MAQPSKPTAGVAPELICGYGERLVFIPAGQQRSGLLVDMLAGEIAVDQTVPLRFRVHQSPGDAPVDDLQVEHEKLMHVIGVRDDLGDFFHIHPQRTLPGLWQAIYTFTNGGRYHVWSDVKRRGTVYSFAQAPLVVAGKMKSGPPAVIPQLRDVKRGYEIAIEGASELQVGKTNLIQVIVRNSDGAQVGTDFFLGALMHLVLVKDDLSVYLHGHAENHDRSQRTISFKPMFPKPGNYKLFAQFRPAKTKMPLDDAILAEFWVQVGKAE
ncbi:MAG TPA: hypothetical protein VFZ59_02760 [Verrucomicrobiae bacterium]|nr:hypothetical protein [Verrucomicrobiae bacterium]